MIDFEQLLSCNDFLILLRRFLLINMGIYKNSHIAEENSPHEYGDFKNLHIGEENSPHQYGNFIKFPYSLGDFSSPIWERPSEFFLDFPRARSEKISKISHFFEFLRRAIWENLTSRIFVVPPQSFYEGFRVRKKYKTDMGATGEKCVKSWHLPYLIYPEYLFYRVISTLRPLVPT